LRRRSPLSALRFIQGPEGHARLVHRAWPEARCEILMQILAGADTTATAIRATILHIISNPRVVKAMRKEIDQANPSLPVITDDEARGMPYLQAVKGIRVDPPVVGLMSKEVPRGATLSRAFTLQRAPRLAIAPGAFTGGKTFGAKTPMGSARSGGWRLPPIRCGLWRALELVFGHGRWACLGKNVALMELDKVFVELVRRFDLVVVNPTKPWHSINVVIFLQSDYWIRAYTLAKA